ncbi:MAG: hypothetical protein FJ029_11975 [Actinobacteria bacterium]|nr:hypothetical protein [Actinomycetota bacterium]
MPARSPARWAAPVGSSRNARATPWQNFLLRWIPVGSLPAVWQDLRALGLGEPGAQEITDVVSCPGTDSCGLAITASMGLNRAIQRRAEALAAADPLTRQIAINISGCPHSCGQHYLGAIGFHGAAIKVGERPAPAYHVFVGGNRRPGVPVRIGLPLKARVPAKRVPALVEAIARLYQAKRHADEPFLAFVDRVGTGPFETLAGELAAIAPETDGADGLCLDWERDRAFVVERGEGECAV